jgi:hypothetical protein
MCGKRMEYAGALVAGVLGIAGAAAIAAASAASAAPVIPAAAAVKEQVSTQATAVNYRRRCYGRGYYGRRYYHRRYAHSHWVYDYPHTDCRETFPAACPYPYPYFGFVYGWHGIW